MDAFTARYSARFYSDRSRPLNFLLGAWLARFRMIYRLPEGLGYEDPKAAAHVGRNFRDRLAASARTKTTLAPAHWFDENKDSVLIATSGTTNNGVVDPGVAFAGEIVGRQRAFLGRGVLDPFAMNNAAVDAGARFHHFSSDALGFLFRYICVAAERDEAIVLANVERAAALEGVMLTAEDVREMMAESSEPMTGTGTLEELARGIVDDFNRVERWRELGRERDALLDKDPGSQKSVKAKDRWPDPPDQAAFHGPAGELVRLLDPATEADPVALLATALIAFGNAAGTGVVRDRGPYFLADGARHYPNEFGVLVGATAKGRKGTSWNRTAEMLAELDTEWFQRVTGGMSSGEGLIWFVRDPVVEKKKLKGKNGEADKIEFVVTDGGVADKRAMVVESEFAGVLKVLSREGNTLSPILRNAWDTGTIRSMVKNSPNSTTDAHISIIAHITADELRERLDSTEATNGLANRFLWFAVRRSKILPDGGCIPKHMMEPIAAKFARAIAFARTCGQMVRDDEARETWHAIYRDLSDAKPGLVGSLTSRAESHVMRLAMIYALLDCSRVIRQVHLCAAIALWEYCQASVLWCFGTKIGNTAADTILDALETAGDAGMTRTDLSALFGRNLPAERLAAALTTIEERGLARRGLVAPADGKGRHAETWWKR